MLRDVKNTNLHLHTFGMAMERDLHIFSLYNTFLVLNGALEILL